MREENLRVEPFLNVLEVSELAAVVGCDGQYVLLVGPQLRDDRPRLCPGILALVQ